jgi:hypothetical protein
MEKDSTIIQMAPPTMGNGKMTKDTDKEDMKQKTKTSRKATGRTMNLMDKE